jgi:membrane-bound lytic murein transglycosylase D
MFFAWDRFLSPVLAAGSGLLVLSLAGCTPTQQSGAASSQPKQATAPAVPAAPAPQQAPSTPAPVTMEQQRVRQLIEQAERAYARGEADYRRGLLPEAKTEFDRAVDLLLASGYIRSTPQLQDELDKIVDQVNALEMEALKQGNGFVPKEEITPAEAASDVTFAVDPNIVAKARAELATTKSDLPLVVNDYVAVFINFFANTQKGHNTLLHSFQRSGHYRAMIQRVLAEEGVPQDLIYLAVAESGFNPRAIGPMTRSGGRAGGMWQFMPSGSYGLTRNSYVDERFDPEKSTRAYGRYMKFIYNQLGDWYLAMAAYDHGTGNIQREVQRTGYADFWELYKRHVLPAETANYVPEILAAIIIANNPTQYGFDDITLDPPVLTDTVSVDYSINLRLVADLVGAPQDEIQALNPSLLRRVTPPDTQFDLHLPAGTATLYEQRVALIPESQRNAWRFHKVTAGDTLQSVAQTFHVSASELVSINHLEDGASLASVEALAIPTAPSVESTSRSTPRTYTARRGDTLVTIADRFGVSLSQLRSWNGIPSGTKVAAGRRLRVAESQPARSSSSRHHKASSSKADSSSASSGKAEKSSSSKHGSAKAKSGADESSSKKSSHKASGKSSSAQSATKHHSSGAAKHARRK